MSHAGQILCAWALFRRIVPKGGMYGRPGRGAGGSWTYDASPAFLPIRQRRQDGDRQKFGLLHFFRKWLLTPSGPDEISGSIRSRCRFLREISMFSAVASNEIKGMGFDAVAGSVRARAVALLPLPLLPHPYPGMGSAGTCRLKRSTGV